ncbi:MAG TPA: fumarylacetoacetate hydrolase family protein [Ktedonobacteraceae bacterium]|nr:fumarylacetoacetate hydrolase family protein [Ktedonobacteraceae bacterium]
MKLVTFLTPDQASHAGVLHEREIVPLPYAGVMQLLQDPEGLQKARKTLEEASQGHKHPHLPGHQHTYLEREVVLRAPVPEPPTMRDFYAFEQHVKSARNKRGLDMIPEWYEIPTFYFTNTSEVYGHDEPVPYPVGSKELDIELEVACVIGREGKDIPVEKAAEYIAGYTIMNDWSARDFQRKDMKLNLGPGKGKDFATSLGPWLVTPDELVQYRSGSGASERYDLTMLARVNGQEISRGNFKDIYYSFPQMIAYASRNVRLRVGDVIGSGTVGTGCLLEIGTEVHPWFQRTDVLELEIDGLGVLRNRIV